jgi:pimeloyl-ACP methyl ester carboxylesterase
MPSFRRILSLVLGSALAGYACLVALVFAMQERFIFPAPSPAETPTLTAPGRLLHTGTQAGECVAAWLPPPDQSAPVVVFFHGNGEQLSDVIGWSEALQHRGVGVLAAEYPGYGLCGGTISEDGIYAAAEAALRHLREQLGVPASRTVLAGHSLGTGVAAEMAARGHGSRLVLISAYTSMAQMGARLMPWLPARFLVRHRFDTLSKSPMLALPALVLHGTNDRLIPLAMARAVAAALPDAELRVIRDGDHEPQRSHRPMLADCVAAFARGDGCARTAWLE